MSLKLVLLSDTHGFHRKVKIPPGDVLIHCGDFTSHGREADVRDFNEWVGTVPCPVRLCIAGNHDWAMTRFKHDQFNHYGSVFSRDRQAELTSNFTYLCDSGITIEGIKFWGSPVTPQFCDWAFMLDGDSNRAHHWKRIPDDTNVLITHGPARGILDANVRGELCGDEQLRQRAGQLAGLKLHCSGHIHESYNSKDVVNIADYAHSGNSYYAVNCSILDEHYSIKNKPVVIDYEELVRTLY